MPKLYLFFLLLCPLFLSYQTQAAKILVFSPTLSKSHMINNARVADALSRDGHNVTLLQVHLSDDHQQKLATYAQTWYFDFEWSARMRPEKASRTLGLFEDHHPLLNFGHLRGFHDWLADYCRALLKTDIVEQIRSKHFDIYIGEQVSLCGSGLSYAAGIPTHLWLSSGPLMPHMTSYMGLSAPSSYIPTTVENNGLSDQMSFLERADNILRGYAHQSLHQLGIDAVNVEFRRKFGSDFPDVGKIAGQSPLILVTADEFVELPRPIHHNVVYIGGLGLDTAGESLKLGPEFESIMQKGQDGVVLISFGSVLSTTYAPEPFIENILKAVKGIPRIQFILKLDKDDEKHRKMAAKIDNIFVSDWHPQPAILNHPRLRLFVTHAGWGHFMEKRQLLQSNGYQILSQEVNKILGDKTLKSNAQRIRRLIESKPESAHRRLIRSIRFLVENGGQLPELQPYSTQMNFIEFYNLDLLLISVVITLVSLWLIVKLLRFLLSMLRIRKVKRE